jgi:glycosyltransferase involved in cell wall biosynthesis
MSPDPSRIGNPYIALLIDAARARGDRITYFSSRALLRRRDIVHVHWPESLIRWRSLRLSVYDIARVTLMLRFARARGARLVWTGHNLEPHEIARPFMWRLYSRLFVAQVDLLVSTGPGAARALVERYPALAHVPLATVPHGHYVGRYPTCDDPLPVAGRLGLSADRPVFLVFGRVRPYKNVPAIVRAWRELSQASDSAVGQLLVAGKPSSRALEAEIRDCAAGDRDIHLVLRFIDDDEVAALFALSDVVVASYLAPSALSSGAAVLALSLCRPVVVTNTPAGRDLRDLVGSGWVYLCDGTPTGALGAAQRAAAAHRDGGPDLSALDWESLGEQLGTAYAAVAGRRPNSRPTAVTRD